MSPVIPIVVVVLACGSYFRKSKNRGVMTAERMKIYNAALSGALKDPESLEKLANAFGAEGFPEQAQLLRQRAHLRSLPDDIKKARRKVWRKAMASTNRPALIILAAEYEKQGCSSAAMRLREYISGLPNGLPQPPKPAPAEPATVSAETSDAPTPTSDDAP